MHADQVSPTLYHHHNPNPNRRKGKSAIVTKPQMSDTFYYHKLEFVKVSIIVCKVESTCLSTKNQVALYGKQHTPVYKDAALSTPWNLKVSLCTHLFLPPTTLQETFGMPAAVRCQPQGQNTSAEDCRFLPGDHHSLSEENRYSRQSTLPT